jgi:CRP/FNR family transcriptional regulator
VPFKVVPRRDRKLYRVVKRGETRTLERGKVLYGAGDPSQHLFLVRSGHLRLEVPEDSGDPGAEAQAGRTADIVGPWEICGEEALVPDTPRRLTALAGEPTQVTVLAGLHTKRALQTSQTTLEAFLRAKEAELTLARALSVSRRPGGAGARLGAVLLHLSDRHGKLEGRGTRVGIPLTHQLLADLSASHRSTVTTLLNDWIYQGALEDDGEGILIRKAGVLAGI